MFYQKLLNPPHPWVVSKVELSEDGSRVDVWLTHEQYTFLCSVCQEPAPTYNHMPEHLRFKFEKVKSISAPTASAWEIKELLRDLWHVTPEEEELAAYFKKWFWRATYSRQEPIRKAAKPLKRHWAGIQAAIMNGISNSATEGLNSKIEVIKRSACGYRNKDNFRTAILFHCGKLDLIPEIAR